MIEDFDDFCLYVYVIIDEMCLQMAPFLKRPGPQPKCSDSELIAIALISECKGWDMETDLLSNWRSHRSLFPTIPSQSRFNRRRRQLMFIINWIRRLLLSWLDIAQDKDCLIDSLPIPVVNFHLAPNASTEWRAYEARFGKVPSKKVTIFGYKLHLLVTLGGVIVDFVLAPANAPDLQAGLDMLFEHTELTVLGDKAYISADLAAELWRTNRLRLLTIPRKNQKQQMPKARQRLFNAVRQMIETVNGQLSGQLNIETNHAHTFWGLCARLYTKLTAHTLCIYINRLLGKTDFLQIKALAFPN